jgi:signal transduction histidine kinase
LEVRIEDVELQEVVKSAAAMIESILDTKHVQLIRQIDPNLPVLKTDGEKFRQILLNLLDNAAKFTERGQIHIMTAQQDGLLKLVVSDTGIGIPEQDLNKVFKEFHRVGSSNGKSYRGTGLGLAIVKRLVGMLGGTIEVSSTVGKGSSFSVTLPLDYKPITLGLD